MISLLPCKVPDAPLLRRIGLLLAEARGPHLMRASHVPEETGFAGPGAADRAIGGFRMEVTPPEMRSGSR